MTSNSNPRKSSDGDKTKLAYWKSRIFKPTYIRNGEKLTSPNFCVEMQHDGTRVRWSLGPANLEAAASRARSMYIFCISNGWEATKAKYNPTAAARQADPTVGQFLAAVEAVADVKPKTLHGYAGALRKIIADITGLARDAAKFGDGQGHKDWLLKVHGVKLSALTPKAVQEWKRSFLSKAESDPVSQRSARVSVNTFLRCARSLFSPRILEHLELEMPNPLPFTNCQFEPGQNTKYRSTFDVQTLIGSARDELAINDPEAFKVFLLGTMVGLRRREIDLLEWSSFRWDEGTIRIEATQHFSAKSEDSYADVAIDAELVQLFRGYQARATSPFVIESNGDLRPGCTYNHYRCDEIFSRLIAWLRAHGVKALKPLHTLRKEFGSVLCAAYGIHAASRGLRHSAVAITDAFYSDSRVRATVGMGHLLQPQRVVSFKEVA
jgi:hypothetical protein